MKTDKVDSENNEKKTLIVGVKRVEKTSNMKSFDYYCKRALTRKEQTEEIVSNLTSKEIFDMQKANFNNGLKSEKERVKEFKRGFGAKVAYSLYQKNIVGIQEKKDKEDATEMEARKEENEEENEIG